jgi:hypothetical protein
VNWSDGKLNEYFPCFLGLLLQFWALWFASPLVACPDITHNRRNGGCHLSSSSPFLKHLSSSHLSSEQDAGGGAAGDEGGLVVSEGGDGAAGLILEFI